MFIHQESNFSQLYNSRRVLRGANVHSLGSDNKQTWLPKFDITTRTPRTSALFTYFPYHSYISNPDDDKILHSRKCAGVDCCLPLDTKSNGDRYGMLTVRVLCLRDKAISYIQNPYMCILNTRNNLCSQIYISHPIQIHHLGTSHKVVATGTSVSNNTSELVVVIENNTVRTRGATSIDFATLENGEFVVGS